MAINAERKLPETGIVDRLSSLPDEIISHILSFLEDTKYAVGTAVLSRRWKDLWTMVSNLDFDNRLSYRYLNRSGDNLVREIEEERRDSEFFRFIDRVLSQHRNLDYLRRFYFHFSVTDRNFKAMQDYLDERGLVFGSQVEEIDVMLLREEQPYGKARCIWWLPESFYTLKNLKVVKLHEAIMSMNGSVSLPSLKILNLWNVTIRDLESLSRFISGCPAVETLCLEYVYLADMNEDDILIVSLPSLTNLRITGFDDDVGYECLCRVVMEVPKLEDLYLDDFTELQFLGSSSPLPCLHSARVDTSENGGSYESLIRLLSQISNVKEMCLDRKTLEFLSADNDDVQRLVFSKLTLLTFQPTERCSSWILHSLLHSAPKLQSLVINMWWVYEPIMWEETEPSCTPQCLLSSLERIEINGFEPFENDVKMVGYLLNVGAVLKKVDINLFGDPTKEECKGLRSLLKLPRESSACEVRIALIGDENDIKFDDDETYTNDKDEINLGG